MERVTIDGLGGWVRTTGLVFRVFISGTAGLPPHLDECLGRLCPLCERGHEPASAVHLVREALVPGLRVELSYVGGAREKR